MSASQSQKANFLQDTQNTDFLKKIIPCAHENNWLQLSFLTINDIPAAAYLNFDYDNASLYTIPAYSLINMDI